MKKVKEMNMHEYMAYTAIKEVYNWNVGGWCNSFLDGDIECVPESLEEAKKYIYDFVMDTRGGTKHMRFAGKEFIEECIDARFTKDLANDEDVKELAEAMNW